MMHNFYEDSSTEAFSYHCDGLILDNLRYLWLVARTKTGSKALKNLDNNKG